MVEFDAFCNAILISYSAICRPIKTLPNKVMSEPSFSGAVTTRTGQLGHLKNGTEKLAHRRDMAAPLCAITWGIVAGVHYVRRSLSSADGVEARWAAGEAQRGLLEER